ncbi:hypothetical protein ETI06_05950 [Macrococcoides goetzii]|nr:hypothetical protein [Macrococcus goetzii]TDM50015.1 hypothetical protein ETI06_05950 [Macrococcus goetzii]
MYILFEYIFDYEFPRLILKLTSEDKRKIDNFIMTLNIDKVIHDDQRSVYLTDTNKYILVNSQINNVLSLEVIS